MLDWNMLVYIAIGFFAQLVDGTIGMAYGICSTTFLTFSGISVGIASASVHAAEVITTFVSSLAHFRMKNIDGELFKRLLVPGIIGGVIGAGVLSNVKCNVLSILANLYLIVMGAIILFNINKKKNSLKSKTHIFAVGFLGGMLDAVGGGWGPIVTSTMLATGHSPRYTIGSVNAVEFFVTVFQTVIFSSFLEIEEYINVIIGLGLGGVVAAPVAAMISKKISEKALMIIVGIVIIFLNILNVIKTV